MPASMISAETGGKPNVSGQQHRDGRGRAEARQDADQRAEEDADADSRRGWQA